MSPIFQNEFPYKALKKPLFETLESERSQVVASKQDTMYHTSTNLNSSRSITTVFYWRTMTTFIFEGAQPSTSDSWIMKSPEIFSLMVIVLGPSFMQIIIVVFNSVAIPCEVKESHWLNNGKSIPPISWSTSSSFSMPSWLSMSSRYHYNRENLQLPCRGRANSNPNAPPSSSSTLQARTLSWSSAISGKKLFGIIKFMTSMSSVYQS